MEKSRHRFSVQLARVMVCVMLVMSVSSTFEDSPSCKINFQIVSTLELEFEKALFCILFFLIECALIQGPSLKRIYSFWRHGGQ